jgi:hypothetical protein
MVVATEFRRYAEDCRRMATASTNRDDRQTWNHLAERWMRCADNAEKEAEAARTALNARRAMPPRRVARITGWTQQAA